MNKTKLFLIVLFAMPFVMVAKGQDLNSIFKKYSKNDDVSISIEKEDNTKTITLNSTEEVVNENLMNDIKNIVDKEDYESLADVHEKGTQVNVYYSQKENDMLVVVNDSGELTVVWTTWMLTKEDIEEYQKLSTSN